MILNIVGTKAQYIKMAPVLLELERRDRPHALLLTGQHAETFEELRAGFGLPREQLNLVPDVEASTKRKFAAWVGAAWRAARAAPARALLDAASAVLVHGDTASTLFGAWLGRRHRRPVVHVEAGLRSFDVLNPFPEELTRIAVSRLASHFAAPDAAAVANLRHKDPSRVLDCGGNTLKDALRLALARLPDGGAPTPGAEPYAVLSFHRTENLGNARRFDFILGEAERIAARIPLAFVLHPATRSRLDASPWRERLAANPRLRLLPRSDYFAFVRLLAGANFLLTDGGSNQEEASMMGLPCLLLRQATERPDGLGDGVVLSRYDPAVIGRFVDRNLVRDWRPRAVEGVSPSARLVDALEAWFGA